MNLLGDEIFQGNCIDTLDILNHRLALFFLFSLLLLFLVIITLTILLLLLLLLLLPVLHLELSGDLLVVADIAEATSEFNWLFLLVAAILGVLVVFCLLEGLGHPLILILGQGVVDKLFFGLAEHVVFGSIEECKSHVLIMALGQCLLQKLLLDLEKLFLLGWLFTLLGCDLSCRPR